MSEQSTEVKGFKNSVLGQVLFKIASIAGLQEALNGKADISALSALSSELSGKLDAVPELEVHFDVSGGALVKVSDETEYDDVFSEAVAGIVKWVPIFIGIYDSNEDDYTKFMGIARISGLTDNITLQLYEIDVDIYVGSYTIHLVKTVSTSTITVSTDRLTSLLS